MKNLKIYGTLTLVSLLYGINYSVLKIIVPEYIGPFGLIVFRVVVSTLIFWGFFVFRQERVDWKVDGVRFFLCAFCGAAANMLLFFKGISLTSAINGSIIMTLTPVLVLIWAGFSHQRKNHQREGRRYFHRDGRGRHHILSTRRRDQFG